MAGPDLDLVRTLAAREVSRLADAIATLAATTGRPTGGGGRGAGGPAPRPGRGELMDARRGTRRPLTRPGLGRRG